MTWGKQTLFSMNMPYALGTVQVHGQTWVVAATEDHGPVVASRPPYTSAEVLVSGPGGCMSLVSSSSAPGQVYAIMGCFLGYRFQTGAVYRIDATVPVPSPEKLLDLPFAHRMEFVPSDRGLALLVSNLAAHKDSPTDWSQPGATFRVELSVTGAPVGPLVPLLEGLHKNHGFLKSSLGGRECVLVSGQEGIFELDLSRTTGAEFTPLLGHEVSEIAVYDLDGDGEDELVTIEPFHGHQLVVYKKQASDWKPVWEATLDYGHCVVADHLFGRPSLLVSNRAGSRDLLLFQFQAGSERAFSSPTRTVVASGVGAANVLVVHEPQGEVIFATNQTAGEFVCYRRS